MRQRLNAADSSSTSLQAHVDFAQQVRRQAHGTRRLTAIRSATLVRFRQELLISDDAAHQSNARRFIGVDRIARQDQFGSGARLNRSWIKIPRPPSPGMMLTFTKLDAIFAEAGCECRTRCRCRAQVQSRGR